MDDSDNGTTGIRGRRLVAMMGVAGVLIGSVTLVASVSLLVRGVELPRWPRGLVVAGLVGFLLVGVIQIVMAVLFWKVSRPRQDDR